MNRSLALLPALFVMAFTSTACSEDSQSSPPPSPPSTSEKIKTEVEKAATDVTQSAEEAAKKAEAQAKETVSSTPKTPSTTSTTTVASELKSEFITKKDKNFRTVELDFAKQKAMNRTTQILLNETNSLYGTATTHLNGIVGSLSEPQTQENYFFDDENVESGVFVVALVRESYVKSEKGDVCQIGTRVRVSTSIDGELTPAQTEQSATSAPESFTEIKCYNDNKPTYYQQIVR